jgi:signal transduction histidine kinase
VREEGPLLLEHREADGSQEVAVTPPSGLFDGSRLRRVMDNLVGNAVKYSPSGGVVALRLERVERADGPWARLVVSDQRGQHQHR